jgi:sulfonate transport system substrate-binding protein
MPSSSIVHKRRYGWIAALVVTGLMLPVAACSSSNQPPNSSAAQAVTARIVDVGTKGANVGFLDGEVQAAAAKLGDSATIIGNYLSMAPALQVLAGGQGDITIGGLTSALTALAASDQITIFADSPDYRYSAALVVPKSSPIHSVADLVGKKIAVTKGSSGEYTLDMILLKYGIPEDKVTKVYLAPSDAATAFASHAVDAWVPFNIFVPVAEERFGAVPIASAGVNVTTNNDVVLVVRTQFLREHPALVRAVFDGWKAGAARAKSAPAQYLAVEKSVNNFDSQELTYMQDAMNTWRPVTPAIAAMYQAVADDWYAQGGLHAKVNVNAGVVNVDTLPAHQ